MEKCREGKYKLFSPQIILHRMKVSWKEKQPKFQFSFSGRKNAGGKCPSFILKGAQKPWDHLSKAGEATTCPKNA